MEEKDKVIKKKIGRPKKIKNIIKFEIIKKDVIVYFD